LVQVGYTDNSYPNFSVRFTDDQFRAIPGITGSSTFTTYPKVTNSTKKYEVMKPFAEEYFLNNIKKSPNNLVNYLLLADVYMRNRKVIDARNLITEAVEKAPKNCLLKMKMAEILLKEENRTLLLEEIEKMKQLDPESLLVMELNIKEYLSNQKYEDASKELEKRIAEYGEDEKTVEYTITLLVKESKYEDLIKYVEKSYEKYPESTDMMEMMYNIKKEVYKDKKGAMKLYESYLKDNYSYSLMKKYSNLLEEQGDNDKALSIKKKLADLFPYSPGEFYNLAKYYYGTKNYDKSEDNIKKALALSPYNESYWEQLGDIKNEKNKTDEALEAYNMSLRHDANQYDIIDKVRKLNGKPEIHKLFAKTDIDELIKNDKQTEAKNTDYGYYYILSQKNIVVHPGGATEENHTYVIRITNEKGVDRYKESSIDYGNHQSLLIEKAEVIKKNKSRIDGEKSDNEIVFTNLEPGDIVIYQYRLRSYVYGRLAKEFWDKFFFGGQIYIATSRYNLLMPADQKIDYLVTESDLKPTVKNVEEFKQYTWEVFKAEPDKDEPLMPELVDVTKVLHVSTVSNWQQIADWYSDISSNKAEEDFEMVALFKELFPDGGKSMTQLKKARVIYDYIESNIRYSSVSFRQTAYVPQRPSLTLTTRLGDCKDLSSLFVVLSRMAGINSQMVLVDTRDNGQKDIMLPGVEFNHCIVKAELDGKPYYIELTDNYLPFASLPNNLNGALILEVPYNSKNVVKAELKHLQGGNRTKDIIRRVVEIKPVDTDLDVTVKTVKTGNASSATRYNYGTLDNEKQIKELEKVVAGNYKNNVKLQSVKFNDLVKLSDSVDYVYNYKVKNEISEIGTLKTFQVIYPDIVASLNNFSDDTRTYPIRYWSYEDIDRYETTVNITLPTGKKFTELPTSETYKFKDMEFSLQYALKTPEKLTITRKFISNRQNIPASDYAEFKTFFEKIVRAEQKFIAFK
jgi:tetratricopeptide (TPR) repeat protein